MRIGIYGGNVRRGEPLTSLVDEVARMEQRGFASYWFSQVDTYDALTVIALAGQQTRTIELGVGVVPTYPRHPHALAQQAATTNVRHRPIVCSVILQGSAPRSIQRNPHAPM